MDLLLCMLLPLLLQRATPYLDQARLWWQVLPTSSQSEHKTPALPAVIFLRPCSNAFAMHTHALLTLT